ncbi:MAG: polymer-forming cytoskeletal protein [Candidatus Goldbacteria bacterium]|nr:polymer-forming cytoskeletal protein [Candidatus Goldiibacteriota bacterium]
MFSSSNVATVIARDCEVKGNINTKGTIRIDGKVEGNVTTDAGVIIGENAVIKGDVECKFAVIAGKVTGDVIAAAKLELMHTGKLYGDIKTPKIVMAEGVIFEGSCEMESAAQK